MFFYNSRTIWYFAAAQQNRNLKKSMYRRCYRQLAKIQALRKDRFLFDFNNVHSPKDEPKRECALQQEWCDFRRNLFWAKFKMRFSITEKISFYFRQKISISTQLFSAKFKWYFYEKKTHKNRKKMKIDKIRIGKKKNQKPTW
jgi:hypothetical protein